MRPIEDSYYGRYVTAAISAASRGIVRPRSARQIGRIIALLLSGGTFGLHHSEI
jgi:membrane protease YdiL (CAAX protease family)